jgi:hypothetical protein
LFTFHRLERFQKWGRVSPKMTENTFVSTAVKK